MSINGVGGTSTVKNGEEKFENYKIRGVDLIQYDYRASNGELYSTVKKTLELCRSCRDLWLKEKNLAS